MMPGSWGNHKLLTIQMCFFRECVHHLLLKNLSVQAHADEGEKTMIETSVKNAPTNGKFSTGWTLFSAELWIWYVRCITTTTSTVSTLPGDWRGDFWFKESVESQHVFRITGGWSWFRLKPNKIQARTLQGPFTSDLRKKRNNSESILMIC